MSDERRVRRQGDPAAGRRGHATHEPSSAEADEVVVAWEELTDDVVRLLAADAPAGAMARATEGRIEIAARFGDVSLLVGPVTAATGLARHALRHAAGLDGIRDALWALDPPLDRTQMAAAIGLTHGILAEAAGFEATAAEATVLLLEGDEPAEALASVVWWAFCQVGAQEHVGATWCTGSGDGEVDEATEQADDVGQASAAIGVAAALVGLIGADHTRLAAALASSVAHDILLPDGVAACLALLDLDREPEVATVRRVCHEAMERPVDDDRPVEADTAELLRLAGRAARRVGGGEGAGLVVLERLEQWLLSGGE